ncbi:iso-1-cytochrome c, partial [Perkinsus olseni]
MWLTSSSPSMKGGGGHVLYYDGTTTKCAEKDPPSPPDWPFWFKAFSHCHDIPSCRRGYEVYRQICATCHAARFVCFRHMVNT